MLELRPNCELCDKDLPPEAADARICTYECTYCAACVEQVLHNVCPTCGGGFAPRPIRPKQAWRPELALGLENDPASTRRVHSKFSREEIAAHVARIRHLEPEER
ncbi:DUF1272 domain-containing protein [Leisingera caerulea]|uniref:DUF1272 domain-containing protein n=1 Tax=Leisingera caerulea TaxID=506591 RepID=A0ABY5WZK3_LEICA|nr:DUF1272 domain-containing protein [Leisingera caerulea]UWQ50763.1 DUF1272 domain-containing protein [Leisingera caerulea]UWQ59459.1 DUF1272 domain-containing protein [Leisingera caerulea]UWQ63585.1 DUF1272 domain-containing protein [Leisingera caerulea]